jgi:hypothetical protein
MLKYIESGWQDDLQSFPGNERFYIDFRLTEYPNLSGTPVYTLVASDDNRPGTYNMTDGYSTHLISLADEMTFDLLCYADFDYDVAADQPLLSWYKSATEYFKIYYDATSDKITVAWKDGTNERTMASAAYVDGLNDWLRITVVFDLTAPYLYIDGVEIDDAWSDAPDAITSNFDTMQIRAYNSGEGLWYVNYLRMFTYSALAADVSDNFQGYKGEEIFFDFDGNQVGKTRCNVGRFVRSWNYNAASENDAGNQVANRATLTLLSLAGEFADDQYSAFDPENDVFNGLITQKYLQQRCRVEIESWYDGDFEPLIRGYVDSGHFSRMTQVDYWSEVSIGVEDYVAIIANTYLQDNVEIDNALLSSDTAKSVFHTVARLATGKQTVNFLCESGFEAAEDLQLIDTGKFGDYRYFDAARQRWRGPTIRGYGASDFFMSLTGNMGAGEPAPHSGDQYYYAQIVAVKDKPTTTKHFYFHSNSANLRGLTVGETYTLTVWVYIDSLEPVDSLTLFALDSVTGYTTDTTTVQDAWTELSVEHTIDADAISFYCGIEAKLTHAGGALTSQGGYINIDDVTLVPDASLSWAESGDVTFTIDATYAHDGDTSGKLVFTDIGQIDQTLMAEDPIFINIGDSYTGSIYALAAAAFEGTLRVAEHDSDGSNDSSTVAISLAGGEGWVKFAVTHTITDEDSDRLVFSVEGDDDTVWVDTAMLYEGTNQNIPFVVNGAVGEAGISRPQYGIISEYDYCGINADEIDVLHPYVFIEKNKSAWDQLKQVADACGARYLGMDKAGVLTMKTHLVDDDPTPVDTVDVPSSVATQLEDAAANKITVSGVRIRGGSGVDGEVATGETELFWRASTCEEFKVLPYTDRDGKFKYPITTDTSFPQGGGFVDAKFGEVK